jgi:hypothetical protein
MHLIYGFFSSQVKTCARLLLSIVFDCLFWDIIFKCFEKLINLVGYEAAALFSFSFFFCFLFYFLYLLLKSCEI